MEPRVNRPESSRPDASPPDGASPPPGPRNAPRPRREGIEDAFFTFVWALPVTVTIPTLARRMLAFLLDLVISLPIPVIALVATSGMGGDALPKYAGALHFIALSFVMYGFYFALWESSPVRATPGKVLFDLRVATATDAPLRFSDAMIRYFVRVGTLMTANAGLWWSWRSPRGQALHDRLCGTFVIAQHVLPGRLRTAARTPQSRDLVALAAASVLAYALVFQAIPSLLQQLRVSDRLDDAIAALRPALIQGDLLGPEGQWSRGLRSASDASAELNVEMEVQGDEHAVLLRVRDVSTNAASRDDGEPPSIRIEQSDAAAGDATWHCIRHGIATYAVPRNCVDIAGSLPAIKLAQQRALPVH